MLSGQIDSQNHSHREYVSINVYLKSYPVIGFIFVIALLLLIFRFTRKSESFK
jgi:hypothetical protein